MNFIHHRINTIANLQEIPIADGVEVDVRYHNNDLILEHDPLNHHLKPITKLKDFLAHWNHDGELILNIKTEGIEEMCINLMLDYQIKSWFFLDLSNPQLINFSNLMTEKSKTAFGPANLAVRFSEFEPIEFAKSLQGSVSWVWVDCFNNCPLNMKNYSQLKELGYKICLVSPELQKHSPLRIASLKKSLIGMDINAVCSKEPDLWK
jgi:hypothetical protein